MAVKDTNPELSATLDSMALGAVTGAAMKAAAAIKPEPLIEEARKAVAEAAKAGQPLSADSPPRVVSHLKAASSHRHLVVPLGARCDQPARR